ncbi:V-type ATPase subunit [Thermus filiformis]|uniref:ATP synthase subunit C n=1 Tax=Thermus filiformis TaxID=276 RepID=A0A0D6X8X1_THEFI|nr:V-type ATPase subunit [Thermus filiformis]KIX84359.1 ATP synthase subunit C [Thermus filiformis]
MDDFSYLNARVRARRASLLPEGFFQEALDLSFPDFLRALSETVYGQELSGQDLGAVDRAVTRTQEEQVADLVDLAGGEAKEALRLLFLKNDLTNLKALLRAQDKEGLAFLPGTLKEGVLKALLEAPDPQAMAQILSVPGHPLAQALREAVRRGGDLEAILATLDQIFFQGAKKVAQRLGDPVLQTYLALEIDALNLARAFQGQGREAPFVPGGRYVDKVRFTRLLEGDYAVLDELSKTPLSGLSGVRSLAELERRLRCALLKAARRGASDPLGVGLALSYVKEREWEGQRIRLLARRAYFGLPKERVEEEVFCA